MALNSHNLSSIVPRYMFPILPETTTPKINRFVFGFYSIPDLLSTLFIPSKALCALNAGFVWFTAALGLIYPDMAVVKILFLVMIFDWTTGVYKAFKAKTFNSFTFQRMVLNIALTFGLITFCTQYAETMWIFKTLRLNEVVMTGFLMTYLVSVIENLHAIDKRLIPTKLYDNLKRILNLDNTIKSYFTKNAIENYPTPEPPAKDAASDGDAAAAAGELPNQPRG